jgi:hypothetical protein
MVKQYPHILAYGAIAESSQDGNGNWVSGTATVETLLVCRAEPNGGNGFITTADGTQINFSWVVYLPLTTDYIETGTGVIIKNGEQVIATDTIKRFSKGQLNVRIWL